MKQSSTKFHLRKSYGLCVFFLLTHIGALFCVLFSLTSFVKIASVIFIIINLFATIKTHTIHPTITALWKTEDGTWHLKTRAGNLLTGTLTLPIFAANCLVILNFVLNEGQKKITTIITNDMLPGDDFRKLKFILRTTR